MQIKLIVAFADTDFTHRATGGVGVGETVGDWVLALVGLTEGDAEGVFDLKAGGVLVKDGDCIGG